MSEDGIRIVDYTEFELLKQRVAHNEKIFETRVAAIEGNVSKKVNKEEFAPIRMAVYSAISTIAFGVLAAVVTLVMNSGGTP